MSDVPSLLSSRFPPNRYERQVLREEAKAGPARAAVRVVARGTLDLGPHVHAWAAALLQGPWPLIAAEQAPEP